MDLVYIVRNGDDNEELRASLRSIEKYAPKYDNVIIVGYKPEWVSDKVIYIPTHQRKKSSKWENSRNNLITACKSPLVSEYFILMNDDFIATRPIIDWSESLLKAKNTLQEQILKWEEKNITSDYTKSFNKMVDFISDITGQSTPINYDLHIPMIINKTKFNNLLENPKVIEFIENNKIILYRSLYGNVYNIPILEFIEDVKYYRAEPKEITTEWISLFDGCIGSKKFPKLNSFLYKTFDKKSIYEN